MLRCSSCAVPCWVSNRRARSAAWATSSAAAVSSARSASGHGCGDQRPNVSAPRSDGVRNGSAASARTFSSCRSAAESRSGAPSWTYRSRPVAAVVASGAAESAGSRRHTGGSRSSASSSSSPRIRRTTRQRGAVVDAERRLVDVGGVDRVARATRATSSRVSVAASAAASSPSPRSRSATCVGSAATTRTPAIRPLASRTADMPRSGSAGSGAASPTVSGNGAGLPVSISRRRAGAASGHASGKTSAAGRPSAAGCRAPSRSAYASL